MFTSQQPSRRLPLKKLKFSTKSRLVQESAIMASNNARKDELGAHVGLFHRLVRLPTAAGARCFGFVPSHPMLLTTKITFNKLVNSSKKIRSEYSMDAIFTLISYLNLK
jgi:hypothetical protein